MQRPKPSHKHAHDEEELEGQPAGVRPCGPSASAPMVVPVVGFICRDLTPKGHGWAAGTSQGHNDPVFDSSKMPLNKTYVGVLNADATYSLAGILDNSDVTRQGLREKVGNTWLPYVGCLFKMARMGGGTGGGARYNVATRNTYGMRRDSLFKRVNDAPVMLPAFSLTPHDLLLEDDAPIYNRNYAVVLHGALAEADITSAVRANGSFTATVRMFHTDSHNHVVGGHVGRYRHECSGRHPELNKLVGRHLLNDGVGWHRRLLAVIGSTHNTVDGVSQLTATHAAPVVDIADSSPIMPQLLKLLYTYDKYVMVDNAAATFPGVVTWPRCVLIPRIVVDNICGCCQRTYPANRDSDVCTNADCQASAANAGDTVGDFVAVDIMTAAAGPQYDCVYAAMPLALARELFHQVPPYASEDQELDHATEATVMMRWGIVTLVAHT